ncbi:uncharacterized protein LOC143828117 isoform X1 [Paroedura picta]|uniref:uncharacterized protein LOC143828117 isoform X1 n=1 Tax=Paroedura picta TaxID=143630 RepID=UPI00405783A8
MERKREVSRRTLCFDMMVVLLTLAFSRETAGATFFYQYDRNGSHVLNCSQSATHYVWYKGKDSSLQEFEEMGGNQTAKTSCVEVPSSHCTGRTLSIPEGGIFACAPWTKNPVNPLFNNSTHCSNFDFFVVAVGSRPEKEKAFGKTSDLSKSVQNVSEKDSFNLTCELEITPSNTQLALYWFKETTPSRCLFSAADEGNFARNFSEDVNCCVDAAVKQRRTDRTYVRDRRLHHHLTIANASSSDSGTYLCVVAIWTSTYEWKIARNVSVEVKNSTSSRERADEEDVSYSLTNESQISLAVIGGLILIGGIIGVLYWKKKAKGNPVELSRDQVEMELEKDECSPYAVSSRKDTNGNEAMYSSVTFPPDSVDAQRASQPGEKVQTIYALLSN